MFRLLVGFHHVVAPYQIGYATSLALGVKELPQFNSSIIFFTLLICFYNFCAFSGLSKNDAKNLANRKFDSFMSWLICLALLRLFFVQPFYEEWQQFYHSYFFEQNLSFLNRITELFKNKNFSAVTPNGFQTDLLVKLAKAVCIDVMTCTLRIVLNTPIWAICGSVFAGWCFRPIDTKEYSS